MNMRGTEFKYLLLVLMSLLVGIWGMSENSNAATGVNGVGYSVRAELPKNQIHHENSFFDLKMNPGQSEDLKVRIYNTTTQEIQVATAIHTAWTNSAGAIEYVKPTTTFDPSLKYKISNISKIQGRQLVTIPAEGTKVVTAKVQVPQAATNRVMLGGWYFKRMDHKVTGNVKGASNMQNTYSYVIGMKYTMGQVPHPDMKLGKVAAGLDDYHRGVFANLRNPTAVMIPKLKVKTTLTNRDDGKVVKQVSQDNVQMAPNTVFRSPMYFGQQRLKAGEYHLQLVAKNQDRTWVFDRDFKITAAQANAANKGAVENSDVNIWLLVALGALGMLAVMLLILLIIYFLRRNRQNDEKERVGV